MSDLDKKFNEDYWRGVADALSLVEDFIYWQREHPNDSKDILEFVQECLTEVRKKIGPSLLDLLGVSFTKEKTEEIRKEVMEKSESKEERAENTEILIEEIAREKTEEKKEIDTTNEDEIVSEIDKLNIEEE
ncbi:MAG: hypothetical protein ACP6IS_06130 [Candidatus Asgardarchaeia archaeon]